MSNEKTQEQKLELVKLEFIKMDESLGETYGELVAKIKDRIEEKFNALDEKHKQILLSVEDLYNVEDDEAKDLLMEDVQTVLMCRLELNCNYDGSPYTMSAEDYGDGCREDIEPMDLDDIDNERRIVDDVILSNLLPDYDEMIGMLENDELDQLECNLEDAYINDYSGIEFAILADLIKSKKAEKTQK